jgi:TRAP-type mannitol/chloroaromatic compound transport system permease small subunit
MLRFADRIDRISTVIGRGAAALVLVVVLVQFVVVLLRYVFGLGSIWLQETIVYAHAFAFLFAAAWALRLDQHVRVDVFYREARPRARSLVDLLGTLLFLLPMAGLILWLSVPYALNSWAILEKSQETAGLPAVFLLKSAIPLFAGLLFLQAVAEAVRAGTRLAARNGVERAEP